MSRTDVHRPTNLITEDYEFAACGDHGSNGEPGYSPLLREARYLLDEGWRFGPNSSAGDCYHCGARLRYYAILKHIPTHTLVKVGETCLDNRFKLATDEFQRLRKNAQLNRDRVRLADKKEAFLSEHPEAAGALHWLQVEVANGNFGYGEFYASLVNAFDRYGELSSRQTAAAIKARTRELERAERIAAEAAIAKPVIEGKQVLTGRIVSAKYQDGYYGPSFKMVLAEDRGFKVWGSVPAPIESALEGAIQASAAAGKPLSMAAMLREADFRVTFTATVTVSDRDECFGFFKRPTKAMVL